MIKIDRSVVAWEERHVGNRFQKDKRKFGVGGHGSSHSLDHSDGLQVHSHVKIDCIAQSKHKQ